MANTDYQPHIRNIDLKDGGSRKIGSTILFIQTTSKNQAGVILLLVKNINIVCFLFIQIQTTVIIPSTTLVTSKVTKTQGVCWR